MRRVDERGDVEDGGSSKDESASVRKVTSKANEK